MKRFLAILLAMLLVVMNAALAEEAQEVQQEQTQEEAWYELDEGLSVLTVRLAANATTGYEWSYEFSDPEALEMITMEYAADETGETMTGVGGQWVASFRSILKGSGEAALTLTYARPGSEEIAEQRVINLSIGEGGQLEVVSAEIVLPEETATEDVAEETTEEAVEEAADDTTTEAAE